MNIPTLQFCPVVVDDVDAAIAFYRDALGMSVVNDVANGDFRWVTLGGADAGAQLVLSEPGAGRSPEDAQALHRLLAKGVFGPYVYTVSDVDAAFERAQAAGVEVLQEPVDQSWGPRGCAFRDPAGNIVRLNAAS